ncbi:MAG: hypothetical protein JWO05_1183 [Gemmatimonadetes bacterium]|nr:hypothetical protein [Gemmatimonadota bacterium]
MDRARSGGVRAAWIGASAVALLLLSRWLDAPSVEYLAGAVIATIGALILAMRVGSPARAWSLATAVALAAAAILASLGQGTLGRIATDWPSERERVATGRIAALGSELDAAVARADQSARKALEAPADAEGAFAALKGLAQGPDDAGIVLYDGSRVLAWDGTPRSSTAALTDSIGIAASDFYLTLYRVARSGSRHAVATVLLDAAPPADKLSHALAVRVAGGEAGAFSFAPGGGVAEAGAGAMLSRTWLTARVVPPTEGAARLQLLEQVRGRAGFFLAVALAAFLVAAWRLSRESRWRVLLLAVALACTALAPLNEYSNLTRLFDPALFFTPLGGPLTANAGALGITSALLLLALLVLVRRHARSVTRPIAVAGVVLVAGLGPFLLRDLARGIQMPSAGVSASLWLIWEVPLFLAAVAVLLAGAVSGSVALGRSTGLNPGLAPAFAVVAALLAPVVWNAPGQWPWWYTFLWIAAIAALAVSRQTRALVVSAATVAALGATTLVWGATMRGKVALAERDVDALSQADPYAATLLKRFAGTLARGPLPLTRQQLLQAFVSSDLASAGYPTWLAAWPSNSVALMPVAVLRTAALDVGIDNALPLLTAARAGASDSIGALDGRQGKLVTTAVSGSDGVVVVIVGPRSRLVAPDPFSRLLGIDASPEVEPPYTLQLVPSAARRENDTQHWRREGSELHGDWTTQVAGGAARAHAEVELRSLDALIQRGALIALLDLAIVGLLWMSGVIADGAAERWLRVRRSRWLRSYRTRLTLALFTFFMVPAVSFAVWSYRQLDSDARQSRELLVRETLRAVAPGDSSVPWLVREGTRLETPLLEYRDGELQGASDPLFESLAPVGRLLPRDIALSLLVHDEVTASRREEVAGSSMLFGYRAVPLSGTEGVLGAPARADELALGRRRRDLGVLVLFATALGALAALMLSGLAARQLARPIGTLRDAALALAGGARVPPLSGEPTVEFQPVFSAFRRMASDLDASRSALEEAQRRTSAVLRNVASGVVAVDADGGVVLANPRAESLMGAPLRGGTSLYDTPVAELSGVVRDFCAGSDDDREFALEWNGQELRGTVTRLARGGAVVTLDDVTALASAQRVLAWGEMARQVAHEIKNPLTPIRLGVQHLRRAFSDKRVDFERVLDANVTRILEEIDRLDEIARSFSRYGSAPDERAAAEPVDVAAIVRDVIALEQLGEGKVEWRVQGADAPLRALARADELREVLLNVFENARLAGSTRVDAAMALAGGVVSITVADNGSGIDPAVLPRIFEPHFSTRTSGSGLGLAISRRLLEGWGGEIEVANGAPRGSVVTVRLRAT